MLTGFVYQSLSNLQQVILGSTKIYRNSIQSDIYILYMYMCIIFYALILSSGDEMKAGNNKDKIMY